MKVTIVQDDLTGHHSSSTTEVKVSVNGKSGVLDLTETSLAALTELVNGQGGDAIRRLFSSSSTTSKPRKRTTSNSERLATIRVWAKVNGYPDIKKQGRIAQEIQDKYDAAHK